MSDPDASKNRQARWLGRLVLESLERSHPPLVEIVELELSRLALHEGGISHLHDEPDFNEGRENPRYLASLRTTDRKTSDLLVCKCPPEDLDCEVTAA